METMGHDLFICDTPNGEFRPYEFERANSFEVQLEEFIKYINGKECNIVDGYAARRIIEVISEIYSQCE